MANYKDLELGFNRTQLFKEEVQPQINRCSALNAVLDFCKLNDLTLTTSDMNLLTKRFIKYIETGDDGWMEKFDEHIKNNYKNK